MLFVVIVIGENDETQLRACLYVVVIDGVGGERTKNEVEIRLCVCVWRWWMPGMGGGGGVSSFPPPAACRFRFRFRFPGFWNAGSYLCVRAWNVGIIRLGTRRESYLTYAW